MSDLVVWPILDELVSCLESAFNDWDHPSPPALICHRTGNGQSIPMFDPKRKVNECCRGLAWVRLLTNYPTAGGEGLEFSQRVSNCFDGEAITVELGALRCWPHAGGYASCDDWAANAYNVTEDLAALRRVIKCCWTPAHQTDGLAALRGQSRPGGISGQCVGNILPVTIGQVDASLDCCEPTSPGSP